MIAATRRGISNHMQGRKTAGEGVGWEVQPRETIMAMSCGLKTNIKSF